MREETIALFHEVVDLPTSVRMEYYAGKQIDRSVRDEVESLIEFDRKPGLLTGSIAETAEEVLHNGNRPPEESAFGPYRVIRRLGEGGMGSVYLAERADGEVDQLVAIKVVRSSAGLPAFHESFLRERRILASLNHPGISRLLDAGHTPGGQPYLVIEYIEGIAIDDYCAALDIRSVLRLFRLVCEAVSFAHRNLIVHRDLKPSNILIDPAGQPKLLDFGIARILDRSEQGRTLVRILTPEYASPEQMRGEAHSTATDIYSLGAVLCKLLTGTTSSLPQIPPGPDFPGDLRFIVRKALQTDPEDRYSTVDAFAADVEAFLENRPVKARAGNVWYRARKFVRRYWVPVTAAAVALVGLSGGLYVANRERAKAEQRFLQVRQLANKVFDIDAAIRNTPGTTKGRQLIVSTSLDYLRKAGAEARGDKDLALEVGSGFVQLAHVQGVPVNANLGQFAQAEESLGKADDLVQSVLVKDPGNHRALLTSATIAHDRMVMAGAQSRREESMRYSREAGAKLDRISGLAGLSSGDLGEIAFMYSNVAVTFTDNRRFDDAIHYAGRSIEVAQRIQNSAGQQSLAYGTLAEALHQSGDLEGALRAVRKSRGIQERIPETNLSWQRANLALALWREGSILGEDGGISLEKPEEAEPVFRQAFRIADELAGKDADEDLDHQLAGEIARRLGDVVRHRNPQEALTIYDAGIARVRGVKNPNIATRRTEAVLLASSSWPAMALHRDGEAKRRIDAAGQLLRETGDYPAAKVELAGEAYFIRRALADFQAANGQNAAAAATWSDLLARVKAANPDTKNDLRDALYLSSAYGELARIVRLDGRAREAASWEAERHEIWRQWVAKAPNNIFIQHQFAAIKPSR
jgi:Protein kinase domain/Tetratricopeptide repeat